MGLRHHVASDILVNIGSGNGLLIYTFEIAAISPGDSELIEKAKIFPFEKLRLEWFPIIKCVFWTGGLTFINKKFVASYWRATVLSANQKQGLKT